MIVVNTDFISGKKLQTLSLVRGSTVHSKNLGRDILSSLKTIVGGEIVDYTNMMNEARAIATQRMVEDAQKLDADAVINVRYASSAIMQGAAEIIAYGTAVNGASCCWQPLTTRRRCCCLIRCITIAFYRRSR